MDLVAGHVEVEVAMAFANEGTVLIAADSMFLQF